MIEDLGKPDREDQSSKGNSLSGGSFHKERIGELQRELIEAQSLVRREVIEPAAIYLSRVDPSARMILASTGGNTEKLLRETSDIDLIVLSEVAHSAEHYTAFLEQMAKLAEELAQRTVQQGAPVVPIFFTREVHESWVIANAQETYPDARIVPIHFLFHENYPQLVAQESDVIDGLLSDITHILSPSLPQREPQHLAHQELAEEADLDGRGTLEEPRDWFGTYRKPQLLWDCERTLADFLLNERILGGQQHLLRFADTLWRSLRRNGSSIFGQAFISAQATLEGLDPSGTRGLVGGLEALQEIRLGSCSTQKIDREKPYRFASELFDALNLLVRDREWYSLTPAVNDPELGTLGAFSPLHYERTGLSLDEITKLAASPDPQKQRIAAKALGFTDLEPESRTHLLAKLLSERDIGTRTWAAESIERAPVESPEVTDALIRNLQDPAPVVRWWSARALAQSGIIENTKESSHLEHVLALLDRNRPSKMSSEDSFRELSNSNVDWRVLEAVCRVILRPQARWLEDEIERGLAAGLIVKHIGADSEALTVCIDFLLRSEHTFGFGNRNKPLINYTESNPEIVSVLTELLRTQIASGTTEGKLSPRRILHALSKLGPAASDAVPLLEKLLTDKPPDLGKYVGHALYSIAPELGLGEELSYDEMEDDVPDS